MMSRCVMLCSCTVASPSSSCSMSSRMIDPPWSVRLSRCQSSDGSSSTAPSAARCVYLERQKPATAHAKCRSTRLWRRRHGTVTRALNGESPEAGWLAGWGSQQRVQRNALVVKDEPQFIRRCAAPTACAVGLEHAEQSRAERTVCQLQTHRLPRHTMLTAVRAIDGQVRSVSHWSRAYKKYSTKRATCVLALSADASRLPKYASRRPESLTASPFSTKSRLSTYLPQCAKLRAVLCCATQCHACLPAYCRHCRLIIIVHSLRLRLHQVRNARLCGRRARLVRPLGA